LSTERAPAGSDLISGCSCALGVHLANLQPPNEHWGVSDLRDGLGLNRSLHERLSDQADPPVVFKSVAEHTHGDPINSKLRPKRRGLAEFPTEIDGSDYPRRSLPPPAGSAAWRRARTTLDERERVGVRSRLPRPANSTALEKTLQRLTIMLLLEFPELLEDKASNQIVPTAALVAETIGVHLLDQGIKVGCLFVLSK
jgi:hypothetical protein